MEENCSFVNNRLKEFLDYFFSHGYILDELKLYIYTLVSAFFLRGCRSN